MKSKAFTLIELLVVIAIVGILSGFVVVQMNGAINAANDAKKQADLAAVKKALIIYGVESGNTYPVVESGCTIGSCPTLDSALEGSIPTVLNGTYTYQSSDGASFKAATVLSSGYAYTYDSTTNAFTNEQPSSGICGTANKTYASTDTAYNADTFCSVGAVNPTNPAFPEVGVPTNWTCAGLNGGTTVNCTASRSLNGVCGSSNGANLSSIPTTNLCNLGTATTVLGSGPWTWDCNGSNGGTNVSCSTGALPVNGACGAANGSNLSTQPSTNLCNQGSASAVSGSGPWTWTCAGSSGGSPASCSTGALPVNGACGTANKTYAYNVSAYSPDTFCTAGTTNPTTPTFPAQGGSTNWTCVGLNTGTTANCTASRNNAPIAGACGTKNGKYATTTPTGTQACATGTITGMTGSYSWTCAGANGGDSPSCATAAAAYTYQYFTTVGTTTWTVPAGVSAVDVLVIGGGGGTGSVYYACGGGAGGYSVQTNRLVSGTVTVVVGAGGAGACGSCCSCQYTSGGSGGNSSFGDIVSNGGGGGGASYSAGLNGGSGGGGSNQAQVRGLTNQGNTGGATGYGNNGALNTFGTGGSGGGGAGGPGGVGSLYTGGAGMTWFDGVCRAGGGGGSGDVCGSASCGGGVGSCTAAGLGTNGAANTGGGGSGGGGTGGYVAGGNGGSGLVAVRYINNY